MENLELTLKLLHRREVTYVILIHISLVETCHVAKPDINKVANVIFPWEGAMNLSNTNTVHPMIVLTPGASHYSCASVTVHMMLGLVFSVRSLHWNPGPPLQMPIRQFFLVAINRPRPNLSPFLFSILFLFYWRPTATSLPKSGTSVSSLFSLCLYLRHIQPSVRKCSWLYSVSVSWIFLLLFISPTHASSGCSLSILDYFGELLDNCSASIFPLVNSFADLMIHPSIATSA